MRGETVNGTWLSGFWPVSRKSIASDDNKDVVIGFMAFEVAGLMSKVVNLWHSLSDREVMNLREWIANSVGVKMLVSEDEHLLMELALNEILNSFQSLAQSVARLGKRCRDPIYHDGYESFVHNPGENYLNWSGWEYRWNKMERRVKKMERFVAAMSLLSQEIEVLQECEQTFRRMKVNPEVSSVKLVKFKKKVNWQLLQVKNLRDMSPWNRSYDYIVRLLVRSLFTILERIIIVFGKSSTHLPIQKQQNDSPTSQMNTNINHLARNHSFPILLHSSVLPSGCVVVNNKSKKKKKKEQQVVLPSQSQALDGKQLKHFGSFKGCMSVGNDSPIVQSCIPTNVDDCHVKSIDVKKKTVDEKLPLFHRSRVYLKLSQKGRLKPAQFTLGDVGLALHYANVIELIEKIVSAPQTIDLQTRDDLYNMLPTTIRTSLRGKLKWYAKCTNYPAVEIEWSVVLTQILEWLAPLAHNMVRWHSQRNFEKEHVTTLKANVLLVQTLYFANQAKTEAAIVELLVGLHYVCRIDREARLRDTRELVGSRSFKKELVNVQ